MAMHTITAMFHSKDEAERAAHRLRTESALAAANVRVLPEGDREATTEPREHGFLASLRNFFMPEEDRYSFAEGMRRGGYMVAADVDEQHAHQVMDVLEENGAIDLDAEEARWRSEGWHGFETGADTTGAGTAASTGAAGMGRAEMGATTATPTQPYGMVADRSTTESLTGRDVTETASQHDRSAADRAAAAASGTGFAAGAAARDTAAGTEERMPLAEERLQVGKRQVVAGRVRIRSYVVETPVTETVHLRQEHVDVERRPVDRPLTGSEADPFREREIEATETREEPVVSKDTRVREELVLHKSVEEQDETVRDTVRRTEVREDHGEAGPDGTDTGRNPGSTRQP